MPKKKGSKKNFTENNKNKNVNKNNIKITINAPKKRKYTKRSKSSNPAPQGAVISSFNPSIITQQPDSLNYKSLAENYNKKEEPKLPNNVYLTINRKDATQTFENSTNTDHKTVETTPKSPLKTSPLKSTVKPSPLKPSFQFDKTTYTPMNVSNTPFPFQVPKNEKRTREHITPLQLKKIKIVKTPGDKNKFIDDVNIVRKMTLKQLNQTHKDLTGKMGKYTKATKEEAVKLYCKNAGIPYSPPIIPIAEAFPNVDIEPEVNIEDIYKPHDANNYFSSNDAIHSDINLARNHEATTTKSREDYPIYKTPEKAYSLINAMKTPESLDFIRNNPNIDVRGHDRHKSYTPIDQTAYTDLIFDDDL